MLKRFRYWFVNVYWYHYRIHTIAVILVAILAAFIIHDITSREFYDLKFVLASSEFIAEEHGELLNDAFTEAGKDLDGDGKVLIAPYVMLFDGSPVELEHTQKFAISFQEKECSLYIVGESQLDRLSEAAGFVDLSALGIKTLPGKPWLADLSGSDLLEACYITREPMAAAVRRLPGESAGNPDTGWTANRELALDFLRMLAEGT